MFKIGDLVRIKKTCAFWPNSLGTIIKIINLDDKDVELYLVRREKESKNG